MTSTRTGHRRARLVPRLAGVLAAAATVLGLVATTPLPASAATTGATVTLTRADISGGRLILSGTVTNSGTRPLTDVTATLWRSSSPLRSAAAVTGALTEQTTTPGTAAVVDGANRDTVTVRGVALTPGDSRPFTVSGSLSALGLSSTDASFWVGVDVSGRQGPDAATHLAGDRTLVSRPDATIPVASIAALSAPPRQLKQNLFADDSLAGEVAGGRLDALLTAAEAGAGWLIDPSLVAELTDMADGYRVQTADGNTAGTGADAARAWLDRLAALPEPTGMAGLFGTPDLGAAAALGDTDLAEATDRATKAVALPPLAPVAVLPQTDAASLRAARGRPVLTPAPGADAGAGAEHVVAEADGVRIGFTTAAQPPALTSPVLRDTDLNRRNARTALARASGGQITWLTSAEDVTADAAPLPTGFVRASLAEVFARPAQAWTPPERADQDGPLDAERLIRVRQLADTLTLYGQASPQAGVGEVADAQQARAASGWWIGHRDQQDAWLDAIDRRLGFPGGDLVSLTTTSRFSMTGATSEFPVTLTNHLPDPVEVRIEAVSDNPQRIRLLAPEPLTVAPGASSTAILQAEASGGGVVEASLRATTRDGRTLTPDVRVMVETTNFGTIGWVIVIVSGMTLVVTTAMRIRQVRARRTHATEG
ncbi:MAG: DUF6049 family protein [Propioniciclava sp.]|uniref:DUF6049 family protein n=1 Tax=Propioniciclava sp. TaxID=2038686 RepID=UPI0039E29355